MKAIKLPMRFDVEQMKAELKTIQFSEYRESPSLYVNPKKLFVLDLIQPKRTEKDEDPIEFIFTDSLKKCPYFQEILQTIDSGKELYRIHLFKADGRITRHIDQGRGISSGYIRVHVPIQTNDQVIFTIDDEQINMQEGECWAVDVNSPHAVNNLGQKDRIHLMIDCKLNEWWEQLLLPLGIDLQKLSKYRDLSNEELSNMIDSLSYIKTATSELIISEVNQELSYRNQSL